MYALYLQICIIDMYVYMHEVPVYVYIYECIIYVYMHDFSRVFVSAPCFCIYSDIRLKEHPSCSPQEELDAPASVALASAASTSGGGDLPLLHLPH